MGQEANGNERKGSIQRNFVADRRLLQTIA